MAFPFDDPATSPFTPGKLFLGNTDTGNPIGVTLEKHALTVAGAGSGKGSALIIPNLLRWPHAALVIDPGAGNVRATWEARETMGQTVHVIDPARISRVPDHLQRSFNPLARLDPASRTYGEDLGVIADGLVMRHDPKHARWDNAGAKIIAGVIDFVMGDDDYSEFRSLPGIRRLLLDTNHAVLFQEMSDPKRGAASKAAAALALADLKEPDGFIENALQNTEWLDFTSMQDTLGGNTCDPADLKTKNCTVFLVIDPDYMTEHGRFLRLFVRMAVSAMARGDENGKHCLFILDEFFSLGKIDYLQKAAGLMRKNGVHLWPILQNLKQLPDLYGDNGAEAFTANSDALIFFGLDQDLAAAEYVSRRIGVFTPSDLASPALREHAPAPEKIHNTANKHLQTMAGDSFIAAFSNSYEAERQVRARYVLDNINAARQVQDDNARREYEHVMRMAGRPRLTPEQVIALTGKPESAKVARSMIVFGRGGAKFNLTLAPHFKAARSSPAAATFVPNYAPPRPSPEDTGLTAEIWNIEETDRWSMLEKDIHADPVREYSMQKQFADGEFKTKIINDWPLSGGLTFTGIILGFTSFWLFGVALCGFAAYIITTRILSAKSDYKEKMAFASRRYRRMKYYAKLREFSGDK